MDAKKEYLKFIKDSNFEDFVYLELLANGLKRSKPKKKSEKEKVEESIKEFLFGQRFVKQLPDHAPSGHFVTLGELLAISAIDTTVQKFGQVAASQGIQKQFKKELINDVVVTSKNVKGYYISKT